MPVPPSRRCKTQQERRCVGRKTKEERTPPPEMTPHLCEVGDDLVEQGVEADVKGVVVEPLPGDDDGVRRDEQPHVLDGEHDDVVAHQDLAGLAGEQVGVQQPHVPDGHPQFEFLRSEWPNFLKGFGRYERLFRERGKGMMCEEAGTSSLMFPMVKPVSTPNWSSCGE